MALIQFYHLLSTPLERALPKLMEKAGAAGLRGVVMCESEALLQRLDEALWAADPASFIPHGGPNDASPEAQPLYLTLAQENPNNANMLVITNGAQPEDVAAYERVLDVFDGHNPEAVTAARVRWKAYKDSQGCELQYIQQQENGGWKRMQ